MQINRSQKDIRKPLLKNKILQLDGKREEQKGGLLGQIPTTAISPLISEIIGKGITKKKRKGRRGRKGKIWRRRKWKACRVEKYIIIVVSEAGMVQNKLKDEGKPCTFGGTDKLYYKDVRKKPFSKKAQSSQEVFINCSRRN